MSLQVITDSACDLPRHLLDEFNIQVLPFLIYLDGREYADGVDITPEQIFAAIRAGKVPTTAQVPLEAFLKVFSENASEGIPSLYLGFSAKLSGAFSSARLAAEEVKRAYPTAEITVVDTQGGSLGQGLIVLEAAQMAQAGIPPQEIISHVQKRVQDNVEHVFCVDDLQYLCRGGRLNPTSAFVGTLLNVKPILHMKEGWIIPVQKVRGKRLVLRRIVDLVRERSLGHPEQLMAIAHADDPETAEQLKDLLQDALGYRRFLVASLGGVLGCHIGVGGVGALFVNSSYPIYDWEALR